MHLGESLETVQLASPPSFPELPPLTTTTATTCPLIFHPIPTSLVISWPHISHHLKLTIEKPQPGFSCCCQDVDLERSGPAACFPGITRVGD